MNRPVRIAVLVYLGFWTSQGLSQEWRWESRLDLSWVLDGNVFESVSDPQAAHSGRFFFEFSARGRPLKKLALSINYKGGLEGYRQYSVENRMVNDVTGLCEISLPKRFSAGTNFQGRNKAFFEVQRGYRFYHASPFVRWSFAYGAATTIFCAYSSLDYTGGTHYDYAYRSGGVLLEFALWPGVRWDLQASLATIQFDRSAFDFEEINRQTYEWIDMRMRQQDELAEITTSLEIVKWAFLHFRFTYQKNTSNSYGYSYSCPKISILAAKNFFWGLTLRFYWTLLMKQYTDSLQPILQLRPDTEHEENSFTLVDLSKDLNKNLSVRLRFGRYRNESPFRDLYYEKNIVSVGFTQRFR